MSIADKILIAVLVSLLPLGFFLLNTLSSKEVDSKTETVIDAVELKKMVNKLSLYEDSVKPVREFVITSISYASESGKILAIGYAPHSNISIEVSMHSFNRNLKISERNTSLKTTRKILFPEKNNAFSLDFSIEESSIVEIQFSQEGIFKTVQFDVSEEKQIY